MGVCDDGFSAPTGGVRCDCQLKTHEAETTQTYMGNRKWWILDFGAKYGYVILIETLYPLHMQLNSYLIRKHCGKHEGYFYHEKLYTLL